MKIDLHNHAFTHESSSSPEEVIEAAIAAGLDGIAFTEHNSYSAANRAEELAERYAGRILILRGAEYDAKEGHVLIFGISDNSFLDLGMFAPLDELVRFITPKGGVLIAAHPFRSWGHFKADLDAVHGICAVEAWNGHNTPEENQLAFEVASSLGFPTTGGSDSHNMEDVGKCYTEFDDAVTRESFVRLLREGRYRGVCARP